jgi:hypothetical protein
MLELNNLNEIEKVLINTLDAFLKENLKMQYKGDKKWTNRIKQLIGNLGSDMFGYKIACSGFPDEFEREWLYDIVWYCENENKQLIDIPLVVESEWGKRYEDIKFDFEKLHVANAKHRLLICQSNPSNFQLLVNDLYESINAYEIPSAIEKRYLIAILNSDTENEFFYANYAKTYK